jgi:catechol 2,3-dioxygenase-like lactoylglutathione lyase family enzyme
MIGGPLRCQSGERNSLLRLRYGSGMVSRFRHVTVDCTDASGLGRFWAEALGWHLFSDDDPEVVVAPSLPHVGTGPAMLFIPVPEAKSAKNRLHLDLAPVDRTRDEEVERLLGLGASLVEDHRNPDGSGWAYLADPEGNEFCVERSAAERGESAARHYRIAETT